VKRGLSAAAAAIALCAAAAGAVGTAYAADTAQTVERVAAVVNDRAVLLSDLRRRAAPFIEAAIEGATTPKEREQRMKELYGRLLEQLVDEELVEQAAQKAHISVDELEIDQAIDNVRRQNSMTEEQFWKAVTAQGFTENQYRTDVRKQLLRLKVINQRVRSRINVGERAVRDAYDDRVRDARRSQRFRASHVFLALPAGASATDVAAVMKQAAELRRGLTPDNFDATATRVGGGDLGWLDQGDLPDVLEEALLGIGEGEIGGPVRGPSGVHVFFVRERQSGAQKLPTFEEARVQLQRELMDKAMLRQEELFIKGLHRDAVIERRPEL
jgi:parvulin-like peptidyl-prolyl isomerase